MQNGGCALYSGNFDKMLSYLAVNNYVYQAFADPMLMAIQLLYIQTSKNIRVVQVQPRLKMT